ncbi:hypothetical protein EFP84_15850 [Leptospira kmetyi]|uniref:Uncharacterized protein n=1 Tax=Leptospira kmetyi TaxID=408139 RepID=A0AAD0UR05_9LEPT|nr:hypothetical protein EFP84_15850 [Leptospira kmetyi]TGL68400.1 hypothetical protein EHQ67_11885 [Leptospira kmetyi]
MGNSRSKRRSKNQRRKDSPFRHNPILEPICAFERLASKSNLTVGEASRSFQVPIGNSFSEG